MKRKPDRIAKRENRKAQERLDEIERRRQRKKIRSFGELAVALEHPLNERQKPGRHQ